MKQSEKWKKQFKEQQMSHTHVPRPLHNLSRNITDIKTLSAIFLAIARHFNTEKAFAQ
jgi:hypothetical protein